MILLGNLDSDGYQHRLIDEKIVRLVSFLNTKVWSFKFIELDVCGRPLFANPVTYDMQNILNKTGAKTG